MTSEPVRPTTTAETMTPCEFVRRKRSRREVLRSGVMLAGALGLAPVLEACSNSDSPSASASTGASADANAPLSGTVSVLAYEDGLVPSVLGPFEKANEDLKIKSATFGPDNEAITKMQAGFQVDLVNSCTEDAPRMYSLGLIQPIETSRIADWNSLFPAIKGLAGVTIDGKVIMIPETGGTSGIISNPKEVPSPVSSWTQLFEDPALAGRVVIEDDALSGIACAAFALGHTDPWHLTTEDLTAVKNYYLQHANQIRTFFGGDAEFLNLYRSGEIIAGFGYHDYRWTLSKEGIDANFVHPEQGWLIWECGYSLGADAPDPENAYGLLNWYTSPQPQAYYAKSYTYVISDQKTLPLLNDKIVDAIGLQDPTSAFQGGVPLQIPENYPDWISTYHDIKAGMS
ncbi:MAG: extracellular solute-binding protein [Actinomycetota bacterium]